MTGPRPLLVALLAAIALPSCGDGEASTTTTGPAPSTADVQAGCDPDVGTLTLEPAQASPGDSVSLAVENTTDATLTFGLSAGVERPAAPGEWEAAADAQVSLPVPELAVVVQAGETSSGGGGATGDSIQLTEDAEPGTYRVVKEVTAADAGSPGAGQARLCAALEVSG